MLRRLHVPLIEPEDVIPHLAKQELHWKSGYSAKELAISWANGSNDFPKAVRRALRTAPEYAEAELIDGFFEREVELGSAGRNSQTDLMVVAGLGDELGIVAVEGKVEESFADLVQEWNNTPGKQTRLRVLCETLGRWQYSSIARLSPLPTQASSVYAPPLMLRSSVQRGSRVRCPPLEGSAAALQ